MKYKMLLMGNSNLIINDIFDMTETHFEIMTTSMRLDDIKIHVKYFQPDAVMVCLYKENRDSITKVSAIRRNSFGVRLPIIIIGSEEDCADFNRQAPQVAGLTLEKPITAGRIRTEVIKYLNNLRDAEEERQAGIEAEKAAREAEEEEEAWAEVEAEEADADAGTGPLFGMKKLAGAVEETAAAQLSALKAAASKLSEGPGEQLSPAQLSALKAATTKLSEGQGNQLTSGQLSALKAAAAQMKVGGLSDDDSPEELMAGLKEVAARLSGKTEQEKTILVVDDDVRMVRVIKRHLEEYYNVASAVSGPVALRYLGKKHVDLVLLDYMMPGMNGPEVLKEIRNNPDLKELPVVFLTGASERDQITEALAQKPQGYLLKPVDKDALMQTIRKLI